MKKKERSHLHQSLQLKSLEVVLHLKQWQEDVLPVWRCQEECTQDEKDVLHLEQCLEDELHRERTLDMLTKWNYKERVQEQVC